MGRRSRFLGGYILRSGIFTPSLVRSIQRGTIAITNSATGTATITAVVPGNSVVRFLGANATSDQGDLGYARITLTDATTVTASRFSTVAEVTTVGFEVTEFWPGVIRSVQRGIVTQTGGPSTTTLATAIASMTKTTVDHTGYRINTASPLPIANLTYLTLISTTQIQSNSQTTNSQETGYQVVEWY